MSAKECWPPIRLGACATIKARIGWKGLQASEYQADGCIFLATPNIKGAHIDFHGVNFISEKRYRESPELMLEPGDVLLVKDGSTLGISNLVRQLPQPSTVNGSIAVIRCSAMLEPAFLHQVTKAAAFQKLVQDKKSGLGVPHLFQVDLREFEVPLPPLGNQRRVAEILDTLDAAIHLTEASIAKLKAVKQGFLRDLLTRGINANGELRPTRDEAPQLYKQSPLGWIPKEWATPTFGELQAQPILGVPSRGASLDAQNIGLVKMGNLLANNELDLRSVEPLAVSRVVQVAKFVLEEGDLLFNTRNTPELVGKTCSWRSNGVPHIFDNNILRARVPGRSGNGHFFADYLGSEIGRRRLLRLAIGTTSVAAIYWKDLRSLRIPAPPASEQAAVHERIDALDVERACAERSADALRQTKNGLMDDLLTGRVRVTPLLDGAAP